MGKLEDNGLGLADFIRGGAKTEDVQTSSQDSKPAGENSDDAKVATDAKDATGEHDKKEGSEKVKEPSPSGQEAEVRSKVEEALKGSENKETKEKPADKAKEEPAKEEQAKGSTWESDENPYKSEVVKTRQQLADTRRWSNELNKQNLGLQRQLQRLEKKIDGTYDPDEEKRRDEEERRIAAEQGFNPEEAQYVGELKGRTAASLADAYEKYGKEKVDAEIVEFDRLFKDNQLMMHRVTNSRRPIQEAMKILHEFRTAQKYGTADLEDLLTKVREEAKGELRPQLVEEITKEIMSKLDLKNKETTGIRGLRGAERESLAERNGDGKDEPKPLGQLFPR